MSRTVSLKGLDGYSRKVLGHDKKVLKEINDLEGKYRAMPQPQLAVQTNTLRQMYEEGSPLEKLLPHAFAIVREAARQVTGMRLYDVQILGGMELFHGHIAEMKTGEGKSLTVALPAYLAGLTGEGVHIVTVNDYLAKRDAIEVGDVLRYLGLTVGCVTSDMVPANRKGQYACDVTYVTNNELGFDYLRDNMVLNINDRVLRGLHYAIIDEADSVLIDEARTPLIISGLRGESTDLYKVADVIVSNLAKGEGSGEFTKVDAMMGEKAQETGDYVVDEKHSSVHLTEQGVEKVQTMIGAQNYGEEKNAKIRHYVQLALQAHGLKKRDRDYIVKDGKVIIIDGFTGRMMPSRRFSNGLHQAIEAKEHVDIKEETRTFATITFQNFFNKYEKKAGMTGTAVTAADELKTIYRLKVVEIPTNEPMIRVDEPDKVYMTKKAKRKAILEAVKEAHAKQQPVLVGTTTLVESEILARMMAEEKLPHQVLNAKHHEIEAEIISHAGEPGQITIATNMAGRGTDIKLTKVSRDAGGLFVIGTERNDARRIDDQLRGRSGRQGDPGKSCFYLSLEDDLLRVFGSERIINMLKGLGADSSNEIVNPSIPKFVKNAQETMESNNFNTRKSLMDFDEVNNEHREMIYYLRDQVLNGSVPDEELHDMCRNTVNRMIEKYLPGRNPKNWNITEFRDAWRDVFGTGFHLNGLKGDIRRKAYDMVDASYKNQTEKFGDNSGMVNRITFLKCVDWQWINHLEYLEYLQQSVGFVGYGQKNPVLLYREKAYNGFSKMLRNIQSDTVRLFFGLDAETYKYRKRAVS